MWMERWVLNVLAVIPTLLLLGVVVALQFDQLFLACMSGAAFLVSMAGIMLLAKIQGEHEAEERARQRPWI
jgi:undecaprenyl pyrophosphate phosphatase UppP